MSWNDLGNLSEPSKMLFTREELSGMQTAFT